MRPILLALLMLAAHSAAAWDGVLLLPDGTPAADHQISVSGTAESARSDTNGGFTLHARRVPLTLLVVGPAGDLHPAITIAAIPVDETLTVHLHQVLSETVTVTTGAAPNTLTTQAAATSVIGREELAERQPEHLVDALVRTPGIQVRGEGPSAVPVVRGLGGGRTLLLLDGTRVTAERRAGPSATFLNPFALGTIEISRGPGSVAYGSDAFGGVIHARLVDPAVGSEHFRYELAQSLGGIDRRSGGVEISRDLFGSSLLAMVHARNGGNGEAGNGTGIPNSSYRDAGFALRLAGPMRTGAFRVGFAVDRARDTGAPAADALVQRTSYPQENSTRLTFGWDGRLSRGFDSLEVAFGVGSYDITTNRERLPDRTTTRQISSAAVDSDDLSLRLTGTRFLRSGRLVAGADLNSRFNLRATSAVQTFDASDSPTTRTEEVTIAEAFKRDLGFFALYDHDLASRVVLSGGARVDRITASNRGGFFGDRSRSDTAFSGSLGIAVTLSPALTATVQGSRGYRDPTLSDRYFRGVSGRGFVVGNPDLEPERSRQFDGALRWQSGRRSLALLGYHYRIADLVERYRTGDDFHFRNRGKAEVKGLELELMLPLPYRLSLEANASLARGTALDDDAPLDDIPGPNAHVGVRWSAAPVSAFLYAFAFAEDDRPGPVETRRPGYATFDAGVEWELMKALEVRVYARNLGDRRYAGSPDANAALAPGRSISITLGGRV